MSLTRLDVENVRNLSDLTIEPGPALNLVYGENASGKTSLLESIYILGRARSFRSRRLQRVSQYGNLEFRVSGTIGVENGSILPIGVKYCPGKMTMRLDGRELKSASELVRGLPLLLLTLDSHKILSGGPVYRRQFLDWGVFHVKHTFLTHWRRYNQVLRQRNAELRDSRKYRSVGHWNPVLIDSAEQIDKHRREYIEALVPVFSSIATDLLQMDGLDLCYRPGWNEDQSFADALEQSFSGDRHQGITRVGPHRADIMALYNGKPAAECASGGQQKQIITALFLAQAEVFRASNGQNCLFLIDDFSAELDAAHRFRLAEKLCQMGIQTFITATDRNCVDVQAFSQTRMFHVKHGGVEPN